MRQLLESLQMLAATSLSRTRRQHAFLSECRARVEGRCWTLRKQVAYAEELTALLAGRSPAIAERRPDEVRADASRA
ncbi:hypothetical protein Rhow_000661 [Rhodococcus wratislaviensis]|uniref:Uncharacterized protein n=1 Tax=Rhodococcus wratislaviensis TaxID=44752 RepID=A0A402C2J0_RHOWR|nr:hypothetical protein [Rhodococcus wratislaviensis]GCE37815.1 hypothetical protein Rhow_000661 [Rhodococcus wratislaviensis]